jgi:hypothetical protein
VAEEEQGGQTRSLDLRRAPEVLCAKPRPVRHPGVDGLADAEPARMAAWSGGLLLLHLAAVTCRWRTRKEEEPPSGCAVGAPRPPHDLTRGSAAST